jgi:septation ring formation regulator EzrA
MSTTENKTATDYNSMAEYLEHLLTRQADRLQAYDIDGACAIADEASPLADELSNRRILDQPDFAEHRRKLQQQYKQVCLMIADQRQEVSDKLKQIRQGLHALGGYAGK